MLTSILVLTGVPSAEWITQTVTPSRQITSTSLRFGPDGNPVIAFCEDGTLRVAFLRNSQWEVEDITRRGNVTVCDLELDSSGEPHLVYWDLADYTVHYAVRSGSEWTSTLIYGGEGATSTPYCAICIGAMDIPMIAYVSYLPTPGIFLAIPEGNQWVHSRIDPAFVLGEAVSMTSGTDGTPHLTYYNQQESSLKYAVMGERFWNTLTVHGDLYLGTDASIATDNGNLPHIAYIDRRVGGLRYAHYDGSDWQFSLLESTGDPVGIADPAIQVNSAGYPVIAYWDFSQNRLKCAIFDGISWQVEPVAQWCHSSSLALDSHDRPGISYFRYSGTWGLVYAARGADAHLRTPAHPTAGLSKSSRPENLKGGSRYEEVPDTP